MSHTLDDIRAEIVARLEQARGTLDRMDTERGKAAVVVVRCEAELAGFDGAVAAMNGAEPPAPARNARRDIAALVLAALTDQPQTTLQIAVATRVQPSRVARALGKLDQAFETATGWIRETREG